MSGILISFEGGEGAGKGTQVQRLRQRLEEAGYAVELTREPGGTAVGERIRYLLKHDEAGKTMRDQTELILFMAGRAQNYYERIAPALEAGKVVICDRFIDSSVVYQGMSRGLGVEPVNWLNNYATGGRKPDVTVLLDVPVEVGFARVHSRGVQLTLGLPEAVPTGQGTPIRDRLEEVGMKFHEEVRRGYLALAKTEPQRWVVVDSSGNDPEKIAKEVWRHVENRLAQRAGK